MDVEFVHLDFQLDGAAMNMGLLVVSDVLACVTGMGKREWLLGKRNRILQRAGNLL